MGKGVRVSKVLVCLFYFGHNHKLILHYKFVILQLGWGQWQYSQGNLELCDGVGTLVFPTI